MIVGAPKEIKDHERRVGLTPEAVKAYVAAGHRTLVERGAGLGSGFSDAEYLAAGATIVAQAADIWAEADLIVKVKEPLIPEYQLANPGQIVFTYFHLAASEELTLAALESQITAVAYETVEENGALPLLKPMSAVAGRMAILVGAYHLASPYGGSGVLPTGVEGVAPAEALILGGGVVGQNAALVAVGLGLKVTILDIYPDKLKYLQGILPPEIDYGLSQIDLLEKKLTTADLIVGAVLIPGARTPRLVSRAQLKLIKPGSVIVDVAIDQGGCFESSKMTSHSHPVYTEEGVCHYCVGNMPGAYARTSVLALNKVTLPYGLELANKGLAKALAESPPLARGLNAYGGYLTYRPVAEALDLLAKYKENPLGL
ncbi:MAG: alanine dehydrogenase [Deltaproteobacteria bacterium]|jgi:alanine dehydrogenase|nr:alanine dehydrogenase [Deltaproteobacteria bacterium]